MLDNLFNSQSTYNHSPQSTIHSPQSTQFASMSTETQQTFYSARFPFNAIKTSALALISLILDTAAIHSFLFKSLFVFHQMIWLSLMTFSLSNEIDANYIGNAYYFPAK